MYKLGPNTPTELMGSKAIKFEEAAYELGPGSQGDFDSDILRLGYSSLSTPYSTIDYNMATEERCACTLMHLLYSGLIATLRQLVGHCGEQEGLVWGYDGFI